MIRGYLCSYCDTFHREKIKMVKHELDCFDNPKNRSCLTCKNLGFGKMTEGVCNANNKEFISGKWNINCDDWIEYK